MNPADLLAHLNTTYAQQHTQKEDAFWTSYMGLGEDADQARSALQEEEIALQRFLQDPEQLVRVRQALAALPEGEGESELGVGLRGWERTFAANTIETAEARALSEAIVAQEGALARARQGLQLKYTESEGQEVPASSVKLGTLISTATEEPVRKSAWEGLGAVEPFVLKHGFLELIKERNRLGRSLGAEDYYDWKVQRSEGMRKTEIFELLDELEELTRDAGQRAVRELGEAKGAAQVTPWNVRYLTSGDVARAQDPYFSFQSSLGRWGRSFAALGIDYRGARMTLDLVDRKGKYENGFMHGPEIAWRRGGEHQAARIHFTANAIPGMVGSGARATKTLFHEGGHAAHFANIDMPAPCFGQEFAPTSVAFAETQSMFLDSLLTDADWKQRYAKNAEGQPLPLELIEEGIRARQPFAAWNARAMLSICYGERALYELPEADLTPETVLKVLREVEERLLFMPGSPRPVLTVPHLLAGESSAYYHGYVMANMGVYQTRAFFQERDGHLLDNPRIGPDLQAAYWQPGNSRTCTSLIEGLCGAPLGAAAYAAHLNRSADEALAAARAQLERAREIPSFTGAVELGAEIALVHGHEEIAKLQPGGDFEALAGTFSAWIDGLIAQPS